MENSGEEKKRRLNRKILAVQGDLAGRKKASISCPTQRTATDFSFKNIV